MQQIKVLYAVRPGRDKILECLKLIDLNILHIIFFFLMFFSVLLN